MGPLLGLALNAAPGIISGVANLFNQGRRQSQEDHAAQGIRQLSDVFGQQLQGNYMDTAEAQGAVTQIEDNQQQNNRAIQSQSATMGMTDEARIAMMGQNNQASSGAFSNLAQSADLWRSRLLNQKQGALGNLYQIGQQNRQNFNQSLHNVLNPLQGAIDGAMNAGVFDNKQAPVKDMSQQVNSIYNAGKTASITGMGDMVTAGWSKALKG
ncbi:hypothetical protein KIH41_07125 [Litoribacter ruber]|uniref:hypothetical protein n=1 Tax=Litoribacter ruber TaxID=702568 RepID=UPI001BD9C966|nr:hypothetical protein [Litoribacter ruber]MBT0811050.1 hypothetical protein [Litoribacter ruber]